MQDDLRAIASAGAEKCETDGAQVMQEREVGETMLARRNGLPSEAIQENGMDARQSGNDRQEALRLRRQRPDDLDRWPEVAGAGGGARPNSVAASRLGLRRRRNAALLRFQPSARTMDSRRPRKSTEGSG